MQIGSHRRGMSPWGLNPGPAKGLLRLLGEQTRYPATTMLGGPSPAAAGEEVWGRQIGKIETCKHLVAASFAR